MELDHLKGGSGRVRNKRARGDRLAGAGGGNVRWPGFYGQGYQGPFLLSARGTGTKHTVLGASGKIDGAWLPESQGVKGRIRSAWVMVWNETYISKGSEGRAGLGAKEEST